MAKLSSVLRRWKVKTGRFTVKEAISKIDYEEEIKILSGIEFPGGGFKKSLKNILRAFDPRIFINKYFNSGPVFKDWQRSLI